MQYHAIYEFICSKFQVADNDGNTQKHKAWYNCVMINAIYQDNYYLNLEILPLWRPSDIPTSSVTEWQEICTEWCTQIPNITECRGCEGGLNLKIKFNRVIKTQKFTTPQQHKLVNLHILPCILYIRAVNIKIINSPYQ